MQSGTLRETSRDEDGTHFEWRFELRNDEKDGLSLWSPVFRCASSEWRLIWGYADVFEDGRVCLRLLRLSYGNAAIVRYWIGVRRTDGGRERIAEGRVESECCVQCPWFLLSQWRERDPSLKLGGTLTMLISLKKVTEAERDTAREEELAQSKGIGIFQDYKNMLLSGDHHDVVLLVKDKEFRAHKAMLCSRSPVFKAMFKHQMNESEEKHVDIADCDPDSFGEFLLYVYTGKAEILTPSKALQLYYAGDKYAFPDLKKKCVNFLKSSLSVALISDVINMAATNDEQELLECAMSYVTGHLTEIMETEEWQKIIVSIPIAASDVGLKAVNRMLPSNSQ